METQIDLNKIPSRFEGITLRKAALVAGLGLLIMTIFAVFAEYFARGSFIVVGDATATANNIIANETLFRIGILSYLVVIVMDVVVAWALYIFLKPVNKGLSLLAGWFRIIYSTIFGISLLNLLTALALLNSANYLKVFGIDQLHAEVMLSLNAFSDGWAIGFVFFGVHLCLLGHLVFKSGYIPKFIGVLLIVAGLGYFADSFGKILTTHYTLTIAMFTFVGEFLFMLWLLLKGSKIKESNLGIGNK